jgi:hypothetical protein
LPERWQTVRLSPESEAELLAKWHQQQELAT